MSVLETNIFCEIEIKKNYVNVFKKIEVNLL